MSSPRYRLEKILLADMECQLANNGSKKNVCCELATLTEFLLKNS